MSGFDEAWLALREAADSRARSPVLARAFADAACRRAGGRAPTILDPGAGSGNGAVWLSRLLPGARWLLVDDDPALLARARRRLGPERAEARETDLAAGVRRGFPGVDAVAGAALLDLLSAATTVRMAAFCARHRLPCLFALSWDGRMEFHPGRAGDEDILAAFVRHQRGDKGFGPALGPAAAAGMARSLRRRGYEVRMAPSDWRLDAGRNGDDDGDRALLEAFLAGVAGAAAEAGAGGATAWLAARLAAARAGDLAVTVGHQDLLGLPPLAPPGDGA